MSNGADCRAPCGHTLSRIAEPRTDARTVLVLDGLVCACDYLILCVSAHVGSSRLPLKSASTAATSVHIGISSVQVYFRRIAVKATNHH